MARFEFIKNYVDTILVSDIGDGDYQQLIAAGYEPNEFGEIELDMLFGDGIAYDTSRNGIVMHYPTLAEVSKSEKMQNEIREYCGSRCDDHIEQWDVALKYGRIGRYKYILDYNIWVKQGNNTDEEIWGFFKDMEGDIHLMDVFTQEMMELDNANLCHEDDMEVIKPNATDEDIELARSKYGILWIEKIGLVCDKAENVFIYDEVA